MMPPRGPARVAYLNRLRAARETTCRKHRAADMLFAEYELRLKWNIDPPKVEFYTESALAPALGVDWSKVIVLVSGGLGAVGLLLTFLK